MGKHTSSGKIIPLWQQMLIHKYLPYYLINSEKNKMLKRLC